MAMSNAEKQRRYRYRALKDPDGTLLTRHQVLIGPDANEAFKKIMEKTGMNKRQTVEKALIDFANSLG